MAEFGGSCSVGRSAGPKVAQMTDGEPSEAAGYDDPMTFGDDPADSDSGGVMASEGAAPSGGTGAEPRAGKFHSQAGRLRRLFTSGDRNAN